MIPYYSNRSRPPINDNCQCILDESISSKLLPQKIADLSIGMRRSLLMRLEEHPEIILDLIERNTIDLRRDLQFLIGASQRNWKIIRYCPDEIQFEKQISLHALAYGEYHELKRIYIDNCHEKHCLFSDKDWILKVFKSCPHEHILYSISNHLDESLKKDRQVACVAGRVLNSFACFDESITSDRHVVLQVVKYNGFALRSAHQKFRKDWEVVLAAVRNNIYMLGFVESLSFCKYWIGKHPYDYSLLSLEMRTNHEMALQAVKRNIVKLSRVPTEIINQEMVIEAVKSDICNLSSVPNHFRNDRSVIFGLIKQNPKHLEFADESLKKDKDFILQLVQEDLNIVQFLGYPLNDSVEIAQKVVQRCGLLIQYFSRDIRENIDIVKIAIRQNPSSIQYCLTQNSYVAMDAVQNDGSTLQYIYHPFKNQRQIVLKAIQQNGTALQFIENGSLLQTDREIVTAALNNGCPFSLVHKSLRKDKETALVALKNDSRAFKYIDASIRNDEKVIDAYKHSSRCWTINFPCTFP